MEKSPSLLGHVLVYIESPIVLHDEVLVYMENVRVACSVAHILQSRGCKGTGYHWTPPPARCKTVQMPVKQKHQKVQYQQPDNLY